MELQEGKEKFIQSWGTLGSNWGINRTMAQVHALLLISPKAMSAEEIMEELKISRGNANMNIRALIDWGLVHKELVPGERREYFVAEKDMWEVMRCIVLQRKKKELEPMVKVLDEIAQVKAGDEASKEFQKVVQDMRLFSTKADAALEKLIKSDSNWFVSKFMNMI